MRRARFATWCRTISSSCLPDRHGAARPLRRPTLSAPRRRKRSRRSGSTREEALRASVRGAIRQGPGAGCRVTAYRSAPDVAPDSVTETYVALRLMIDNWRWAGVPFFLRTGKALAARRTRGGDQVQGAAHLDVPATPASAPWKRTSWSSDPARRGHLPAVQCQGSRPGIDLASVGMDFRYKDYF